MRGQRAHQQAVAIGRRARDRLGADVAAGAAAVVDDDLLAELPAQFEGDDAADDVGRAVRRIALSG
jgi:hypothetical protein